MNITWPSGKYTKELKAKVSQHKKIIQEGKVLVIDPSSRVLGYAVIDKGKIVDTGTIELELTKPVHKRLRSIVNILEKDGKYDLVAVELIRGRMAPAQLMWSVGAVQAGINAPYVIEIAVVVWKALAKTLDWYVKDDAMDAEVMALTLIELAKEV